MIKRLPRLHVRRHLRHDIGCGLAVSAGAFLAVAGSASSPTARGNTRTASAEMGTRNARQFYQQIRGDRGPPPEQQRNLVKDGEEFHVTLLEENELGVVAAGGRWGHLPWPKGMLEGPIGHIGDVRCRLISAEAQLWAEEVAPHALSHARRDRDYTEIALLREALAAEDRRHRH
jgi:hypothetical protein